MAIEIKTTCPLGHTCEQVSGGVIERCAWYVTLEGKNPQNGKDESQSKCSIAWQPLLLIEGNGMIAGTNASIQSMRNETIKRQEQALGVIKNAKNIEHK